MLTFVLNKKDHKKIKLYICNTVLHNKNLDNIIKT